jgi:tRNA threonylcarbamoyladenosine biosynthesis protein TsaE
MVSNSLYQSFNSHSPEETLEAGKKIAKSFPNALVLLYGSLGAGKTLFSQGFAQGLEISQYVSSPSYTLMNEYKEGENSLFHLDLYRINCFEEVIDIGLFEILEDGYPCLIEWPDRVSELTKLPHLEIRINRDPEKDDQFRQITWKYNGDKNS